jgi:magnesium-transporting ATPase (P-type)
MKVRLNKGALEKVEFVIYNIVFGTVAWIIICGLVSFQRYVMVNVKNMLFNFLFYFIPFILLNWFFSTSRKRSQWEPYGVKSDFIGGLISAGAVVILLITIGTLNISL